MWNKIKQYQGRKEETTSKLSTPTACIRTFIKMRIQVYMHLLLFLNTYSEETIKVLSKTHLSDIIKGSMSHPERYGIFFFNVPSYYKKKRPVCNNKLFIVHCTHAQ